MLTDPIQHNPDWISQLGLVVWDITNVSDYDFVFIPGGGSPANLIEIPAALGLVVDAYNAGLVLAGICHGPWVFAAADIIAGRNISGNSAIQSYIVSAGANFIPDGIVIDGPFVTADVGYMYDFAQQGILKGLGLFESDPPVIHKYTIIVDSSEVIGSISITVEVSDAFDTKNVIAQLYKFNTESQEYVLSRQAQLSRNENNTIYSNTIESLVPGNYSLNMKVEDVLGNIGINADVFRFIIGDPNSTGLGFSLTCILLLSGVSLIALIFTRKKARWKQIQTPFPVTFWNLHDFRI